mgnify:CR=1 FL=1
MSVIPEEIPATVASATFCGRILLRTAHRSTEPKLKMTAPNVLKCKTKIYFFTDLSSSE